MYQYAILCDEIMCFFFSRWTGMSATVLLDSEGRTARSTTTIAYRNPARTVPPARQTHRNSTKRKNKSKIFDQNFAWAKNSSCDFLSLYYLVKFTVLFHGIVSYILPYPIMLFIFLLLILEDYDETPIWNVSIQHTFIHILFTSKMMKSCTARIE